MSLEYVTVICDLFDGASNILSQGAGYFTPAGGVILTDPADHQVITQVPVPAAFKVTGSPSARLLATSNASLSPGGWQWTFTPPAASGMSPFSFYLPYSAGATQYLSQLAPVAGDITAVLTNLDGGTAPTGLLPAGTLPAGLIDGGTG